MNDYIIVNTNYTNQYLSNIFTTLYSMIHKPYQFNKMVISRQIGFLCLLLITTNSLRLFMIGGHAFEDSPLYNDLAASVANRQPTPGKCIKDWVTTKCPKVAVITSSHETEAEGDDVYYIDDDSGMSYEHIFLYFGMSPMHISVHADNYNETTSLSTPRGKQNLQILLAADILYFTGGDQSKHVRAWLKDDGSHSQLLQVVKKRAINNQIVIAGTSAGSMMYDQSTFGYGSPYGAIYFANSFGLAPKTILDASINGTNLSDMRNGSDCLQYQQNAGKMPGFDWVDIIFDTHFHARGRIGRITAIMIDLKRTIGIGLDENTSLFYENGQGKVFGEHGVTIFDLSNAVKIPSEFLQLKNVKVHYLTQGDSYDFKTKIVKSSKPLITNPQYKNSTDSEDIFDSYQGSLLLTRLVDQTSLFNRGRSDVPQGFPTDAPIFELTFSKGSETKGYRQGQAYTVSNAILDYSYISQRQKSSLQTQ